MNYSDSDDSYRIYFTELERYEDMEVLFERFEKHLGASVHEKIDGPYARIWLILIQGKEYKLVVDEVYGSMLVSGNPFSTSVLKSLYNKIGEFIQ